MSALSQATRFGVFERLAAALPDGMASGDLAASIGAPPNTMSAHLAILERAGLVGRERVGRMVFYRALPEPARELASVLGRTCDGGSRA